MDEMTREFAGATEVIRGVQRAFEASIAPLGLHLLVAAVLSFAWSITASDLAYGEYTALVLMVFLLGLMAGATSTANRAHRHVLKAVAVVTPRPGGSLAALGPAAAGAAAGVASPPDLLFHAQRQMLVEHVRESRGALSVAPFGVRVDAGTVNKIAASGLTSIVVLLIKRQIAAA